jgi:hypothetical protein
MNRAFATCLLLFVLFSACKPEPQTATPVEDFKFSTQYDPIVACYANSTMNFSFTVKVLKGDISKNKLTCSISDFPFGTTVTPQTMLVGQLLGGVFSFNIGNLSSGDYPMKLTISSPTTGDEIHNMILRVQPPIDYGPVLAGMYGKSYDFCMPSTILNYPSVVSTVADTPYKITISNIGNMGAGVLVRAWLSNIVTIPVQNVGAFKIWGSGTYSKDGRAGHENDYVMQINDTLANGTDTQRCIIHIEH